MRDFSEDEYIDVTSLPRDVSILLGGLWFITSIWIKLPGKVNFFETVALSFAQTDFIRESHLNPVFPIVFLYLPNNRIHPTVKL